jgi:hypothetical protein
MVLEYLIMECISVDICAESTWRGTRTPRRALRVVETVWSVSNVLDVRYGSGKKERSKM